VRLVCYLTDESLKELSNLCLKYIKTNKKISIRTDTAESAENISDYFWKLQKFLPNSTETDPFATIQPILISNKSFKRDIFINFEGIWENHDKLTFSPEVFIIWNHQANSKLFQTYKHVGIKWEKV
jgi:DNA polymerase IIIc chi subunit